MMNKKQTRLRRAKRTRYQIKTQEAIRLCVHKTSQHTYAQIIAGNGSDVIASASTLDNVLRTKLQSTSNVEAAKSVGKLVAERAIKAGIRKVAFDRSGFTYHGRIKALADAARESGLEF